MFRTSPRGASGSGAIVIMIHNLETLTGIPENVRELEPAALRKLRDMWGLRACPELERVIIEGCPALSSLSGVDACKALKILSLFNASSSLRLPPEPACGDSAG
jgi:hypothetical protein